LYAIAVVLGSIGTSSMRQFQPVPIKKNDADATGPFLLTQRLLLGTDLNEGGSVLLHVHLYNGGGCWVDGCCWETL
jgi:hypothetical protein